jgi:seryl-tRNA synthetase
LVFFPSVNFFSVYGPQKKEDAGQDETIPDDVVLNLEKLTADVLRPLTVTQLKRVRVLIDEQMELNAKRLEETEAKRNAALKEIGNILHPSVPIDDNEDNNAVERTVGDVTQRTKYSHYDLIFMIGGMDGDRGAAVSGARGYFLKVNIVIIVNFNFLSIS